MLRTLLAMSTAGSPKKKNGASSEKSTGSVQVAAPDLMFPSLLREYDQTILSVTRGNLDGCADLKKTVEELFQPLERQGVGQVVGSISNLDDWTKEMRGQRAALRKFRQDLEKQKTQLQNAHKVIKEALVVKENGIGTMETKSRGGQQQKKPEVLEARIGSFIGPVDDLLLQNNSELTVYFKVTPLTGCVVSKEENGPPIVNQLMSIPPGGEMTLEVSHENDPRGVGPDEGCLSKEYTIEVAYTTAEPQADTVWKFVWVPYSILWNGSYARFPRFLI